MKRVVNTVIMFIFGISFCMAQNIRDAAEEQRRREAQQRQVAEEFKRREAQQQPQQQAQQQVQPQPQPQAQPQQQQPQAQPQPLPQQPQAPEELTTMVTSAGTLLRGSTLANKLDWLQRRAESHNTYIVEVNANENIAPRTLQYTGAINITVILKGDGANRTVRLSSNGTMFIIKSNVTFILDNNITLQGHRRESGGMVYVDGGTFIMNAGSSITDNIATGSNLFGAGVFINSGTFTMNGGTISGNVVSSGGAGVYVANNFGSSATFTMTGGTISGNTSAEGGGVYVGGTFTMRGGTITGNAATKNGGGVYFRSGTFTKVGGTITGYNSDQKNGNAVRDDDGIIARSGHAVYIHHYSSPKRKETTAGSNVNLSNSGEDNWDQ